MFHSHPYSKGSGARDVTPAELSVSVALIRPRVRSVFLFSYRWFFSACLSLSLPPACPPFLRSSPSLRPPLPLSLPLFSLSFPLCICLHGTRFLLKNATAAGASINPTPSHPRLPPRPPRPIAYPAFGSRTKQNYKMQLSEVEGPSSTPPLPTLPPPPPPPPQRPGAHESRSASSRGGAGNENGNGGGGGAFCSSAPPPKKSRGLRDRWPAVGPFPPKSQSAATVLSTFLKTAKANAHGSW